MTDADVHVYLASGSIACHMAARIGPCRKESRRLIVDQPKLNRLYRRIVKEVRCDVYHVPKTSCSVVESRQSTCGNDHSTCYITRYFLTVIVCDKSRLVNQFLPVSIFARNLVAAVSLSDDFQRCEDWHSYC